MTTFSQFAVETSTVGRTPRRPGAPAESHGFAPAVAYLRTSIIQSSISLDCTSDMADYYALTGDPLASTLHGTDADYAIRTLSDRERLSIEDYFFKQNIKLSLRHETTAVIVPQNQSANATLEDFAILIEFALGVLSVSGFQAVNIVATLNGSNCTDALQRSYPEKPQAPTFPKKLVKAAASTWVRHFFAARRETKDKLHITADRFVRYLRMNNTRDALVDLCICLESLIESQTEISFRFAVCLAKASGLKNAAETSDLLSDLYDLRSKVVHGSDFTKEHKKVEPNTVKLRLAARAILTAYVLYLTENKKEDWKKYLRSSLLS
jgi:hypothetical protein